MACTKTGKKQTVNSRKNKASNIRITLRHVLATIVAMEKQ
jgi:hypothetical protein